MLKKQVNALIPEELDKKVTGYMQKNIHLRDRTSTICELLNKGVEYDNKIKEMENLYQSGIIASYHLLRELAKLRDDGEAESFIKKCDENYSTHKDELHQMIVEWGVPNDL